MSASPSRTETEITTERTGRQVRLDLVAGIVLLGIAAFYLVGAGSDTLDWVFPLVLSYAAGAIGLVLVIRGLLGLGDLVSVVPPIVRGFGLDIAVFVGIAIVYVAAARPLGFWPVTAAMIFGTSIYLAGERSRRTILISLAVSIGACVLGYLLLELVFYVPFPRARWLPF